MKNNILCDICVVGDTPYVAAVQDGLRAIGNTTYLVYIGDPSVRYMYIEDIPVPHINCRFKLCGVDTLHRLRITQYYNMFRNRFGGDVWFFYELVNKIGGDASVDVKLSWADADTISRSRGCVSDVRDISLVNRFMVTSTGVVVEFNSLVWCASLKKLSKVLKEDVVFSSIPAGVNLAESVSILKPTLLVGPIGHCTKDIPIVTIRRGFLSHHILPQDSSAAGIKLEDYVKCPTSDTEDFVTYLESKSVYCIGPRAVWNSGLSLSSELMSIHERISTR